MGTESYLHNPVGRKLPGSRNDLISPSKYTTQQIRTRNMALPAKQEIEALTARLNAAAAAYSDAPDLAGYLARVEIIAKAKELVRALQMPEQLPNYHGLNV